MHISSRLKETTLEEIPNITSDIIEKLRKLNIESVYQLAVQSSFELSSRYEDTSIGFNSASAIIANARKILIEHEVLAKEFSTAENDLPSLENKFKARSCDVIDLQWKKKQSKDIRQMGFTWLLSYRNRFWLAGIKRGMKNSVYT